MCSCRFGMSMGEVEFRSLLNHPLEPEPIILLKLIINNNKKIRVKVTKTSTGYCEENCKCEGCKRILEKKKYSNIFRCHCSLNNIFNVIIIKIVVARVVGSEMESFEK